jgi:hypothetical protein
VDDLYTKSLTLPSVVGAFAGDASQLSLFADTAGVLPVLRACLADIIVDEHILDFAVAAHTGISFVGCPLTDRHSYTSHNDTAAISSNQRSITPSVSPYVTSAAAFTPVPARRLHDRRACMLPTQPIGPRDDSTGWRLADVTSRLEFANVPAPFSAGGNFSLTARANAANGLLLAAVGTDGTSDHLVVFIRDGYLMASYDCGSGAVLLNSSATLMDFEFHNVCFLQIRNTNVNQ